MRIALISGLWPTIDENGLRDLAWMIQKLGHQYQTENYHYSDYIDPELYDGFIGHSFGGWKAHQLACSKHSNVSYLALIDPVATGWDWFSPQNNFMIPSNVERADGFRRIRPWFPAPSSLILNPNIIAHYYSYPDIDMGHKWAPKNPKVVQTILSSLKI